MTKNNPIHVLLVEDNPNDVALMNEYIKEINSNIHILTTYELNYTENMRDTGDYLYKNHTDIIILDLDLPDSTGIKTLSKIGGYFRYIPVIILTGHNDESMGIESIKMGVRIF